MALDELCRMDSGQVVNQQNQAWAQQKNETGRAYAAFMDYCRMGPGRSLSKLLDRQKTGNEPATTKRFRTLADWSVKFAWQARVAAFDIYQEAQTQALWEERRRQMLEADWAQGEALRGLGAKILAEAPKFLRRSETTLANGNIVITIELDAHLAVKAIQAGSNLQRLATDEPTERVSLSGSALESAIAAELARLAYSGTTGNADETEADQ